MHERFSRAKRTADERRGPWTSFEVQDRVLVQGLRPGDAKWLPGVIEKRCSASTYIVCVGQENRFVHADNSRPCSFESAETVPSAFPCSVQSSIADFMPEPSTTRSPLPTTETPSPAAPTPEPPEDAPSSDQRGANPHPSCTSQSPHRAAASPQQPEALRRSTRTKKPPDWYRP